MVSGTLPETPRQDTSDAFDEFEDGGVREVGSSDFGCEPFINYPEDVTLRLFESHWPELDITRQGTTAVFDFTEHIYTKFWEHKYHARTFCDAMLRAIRRLASEGAPFSDPELDGEDDVHLFVRWRMRLDATRPARESLLAAKEAFDTVWQRANAILDDSDSVLLLGKDTDEHMDRLQAMKRVLEDRGYYVYIIKDEPDRLGETTIQKVLRYALSSRFILVENTYPSGHLYELPHVTKMAESVTAVLQERGRGATWMFEETYFRVSHWRKFEYEPENLAGSVIAAADWAQEFVSKFGEHQTKVLPWMRPKA